MSFSQDCSLLGAEQLSEYMPQVLQLSNRSPKTLDPQFQQEKYKIS
jgi:hypothetical protein